MVSGNRNLCVTLSSVSVDNKYLLPSGMNDIDVSPLASVFPLHIVSRRLFKMTNLVAVGILCSLHIYMPTV